jgi:hypothetical protein
MASSSHPTSTTSSTTSTPPISTPIPLTPSQLALLPHDKFDVPAISHLSTLPPRTLYPLVPGVLEWIQDINWPIAPHALTLLAAHPILCVNPIREVLRGDDYGWKYNIICYLLPGMPVVLRRALARELRGIVERPTVDERESGVVEEAEEVLNGLGEEEEEPQANPV